MKLTLTTFLSLDGVMQAPGGPDEDRSGGFTHGGWTAPHFNDEMGPVIDGYFEVADAFLLGRRTYEIFAAHWPRITDPDDPLASKLNQLPKYVAATTRSTLEWQHSQLLTGDVPAAVAALKEQPGRELQIHGSGALARSLMPYDLIDEYRLWIFPVVLGDGERLFPTGSLPTQFQLTEHQTTRTGVAYHVYQPTGRPTYGSFALAE